MKKTFPQRLTITLLAVMLTMTSYAGVPKVGLVLGGGGAKGAATIGALKVIERSGIKIDYIAGTSIGAIIGGLYASGYTLDELETLFLSQEWQDVLESHRVDAKLKTLFHSRGIREFSDTRIPFWCVATERQSLAEVDFSSGDIVKAVRASMSIPELYEPVKWNDTELVDGGMVNNLPVDVVKEMGADIVIAIDLKQEDSNALGISIGVGGLVDWFLSRPDIDRYTINLEDVNVHIHPDLPDFTAMSFGHDNCELMMNLGEQEAQTHWEELQRVRNLQR
ncbi:MAG: patatin-like phospholipase family protein [Prevotella sp.]|nr:patatin-like phospholipase family protein [Prevotella sp.]